MKKDEHIQIPKSILKKFSTTKCVCNDEERPVIQHIIFVMNEDCDIFPRDIKDCNIQTNYYDVECEKHIALCETAFGDLKTKIFQSIKKNHTLSFSSKDVEVAKNFYKMICFRSPRLHNSIIGSMEKEFSRFDFDGLQNEIAISSRPVSYIDNKDELCVIINETNINFVIAQSCWILFGLDEDETLFMPISPNIAIALCHHQEDNKQVVYHFDVAKHIEWLNYLSIYSELEHNQQYVYAKSEYDLQRYVTEYKKMKKKTQLLFPKENEAQTIDKLFKLRELLRDMKKLLES